MGSSYDPDSGAVPATGTYQATAALSNRDVSIRVPINYVAHAAVILQAACFSDNVYDDTSAQRCISNLLATGFRRLVIDLYWDPLSIQWTLCPAALPSLDQDGQLSSVSQGSVTSTKTSATATSSSLTSSSISASATSLALRNVENDLQILKGRATTTETPVATATATPVAGTSGLFQIGDYQCTTTVDIYFLLSILEGYLTDTSNDLQATMNFLIFNLRTPVLIASTADQADLPQPSLESMSDIMNSSLASFLYTPPMLASERENLNETWFSVSTTLYKVDTAYFSYNLNSSNYAYTSDGWPNEGYAVLDLAKRVVAGFGTVEYGSSDYDTDADDQILFGPGELTNTRDVTFDASGNLTSGCAFNNQTTDLTTLDDSFATPLQVELDSTSPNIAYNAAYSMARCGLNSLLNETLLNSSAATNVTSYTDYITASSWSWFPGEPSDQSSNRNDHCAAMNISAVATGRWRVASCQDRFYGACRIGTDPLKWVLTDQRGSYDSVNNACPDNSTFAVPQTALENAYLYSLAVDTLDATTFDTELIWLNFNDLDVAGCWVTGSDSRCTYSTTKSVASRQVVVPTVVAVIVFVLALMTILVKCASNRKGAERSKRRLRQRDGLGEYEGVPS